MRVSVSNQFIFFPFLISWFTLQSLHFPCTLVVQVPLVGNHTTRLNHLIVSALVHKATCQMSDVSVLERTNGHFSKQSLVWNNVNVSLTKSEASSYSRWWIACLEQASNLCKLILIVHKKKKWMENIGWLEDRKSICNLTVCSGK